MRAITCPPFGEAFVLTLTEVATPIPTEEQLLVKVKATALNRADLLQRRGKYPPPPGESNILGLELAGDVVETGSKVTDFKVGDRIFGLVGSGSYAEYAVIDQKMAIAIPEKWSYEEAAAIPEAFLTAFEAILNLGQLKSNETILIHAGGSGVGSAAIQLAKLRGAYIITTISAVEKEKRVQELGADWVINYKMTDFAEEISKKCGVDVILDFIGANYLSRHFTLLNSKGRLICIGLMGGKQTDIDLATILNKQLQIKGLIMRTRSLIDKRTLCMHFKETIWPHFLDGQLYPVIDQYFSWQEAAKAHLYMESNLNVGKIILTID